MRTTSVIHEFLLLRQNIRWVIGATLTLSSLSSLSGVAIAELKSTPFVVGFERFARHQEIDPVAGGQLLLTELSCTACHVSVSADLKPKLGPRLNGAGNRLTSSWMISFLISPHTTKSGTTMPDVLAGLPEADRRSVAVALAAFLSTQQESFPEIKGTGAKPVPYEFWNLGDAEQGRQLYHRVGCVACHEADADYETVETKPTPLDQLLEQLDEDELKDLGLATAARRVASVPHGNLRAKYSTQSLTFFLLDPHKTRPTGRMPNLKLGVVEAADIAAWLMRDASSISATTASAETADENKNEIDAATVSTGRRLFTELGCVNCHSAKDVSRGQILKPLSELELTASSGCIGTPRKGLPHYSLDSVQIEALKAALAVDRKEPATDQHATAGQQTDQQMLRLNCLACHERNSRGGIGRYRRPYFETVGHVDIGDEGRLPPPLTGAGSKLQAAWLTRVLKGVGDVRPHLRIRMPLFPLEQVQALPALLVQADNGTNKHPTEQEVFGDASKLAEAGRLLLDTGCVQCHPLRGEALPGVVGIDLEGIANRVRPQWFHDFLLNPGSLKPRTRMPTFFPSGKSQNMTILDGDTNQQIAAMWAYLKNISRLELPPKIERARSQNYELIPQDRPLVLRSFMEHAGTHAIAVGFPERVHIAFDAEQVRLATAWRGRFLDAQGTWFVRFAPPADPLGEEQIRLPSGVPFATMTINSGQGKQTPAPTFNTRNTGYQFRGYRLDKSGVPTFLYRFDRFDIEDRIWPETDQRLNRQFTITDRKPDEPPASVWFRIHSGKSLKADSMRSYTDERGLTVTVTKDIEDGGELLRREGGSDRVVPLKINRKKVIEVRYQW